MTVKLIDNKDNVYNTDNPEGRLYFVKQLLKGETLLLKIPQDNQHYGDLIRPLTRMYWSLNAELRSICESKGYSLKQWEWIDGDPLEALADLYSGLACTDWYQRQLGTILLPTNHPWPTLDEIHE